MSYYQTQGISASLLKIALKRSLAHFKYALDNDHLAADEPTPAMRFGTFCHCMVLEPQHLFHRYGQMPEGMRRDARTTAYKQLMDLFAGKILMTTEEWDEAAKMAEAIAPYLPKDLGDINEYLIEPPFWNEWTDLPLRLKAKPDIFCCDGTIYDLKFIADASPRGIQYQMAEYAWPLRAAHYLKTVHRATRYVYVFCEKEPPYVCGTLEIEGIWLEIGNAQWERLIAAITEAFNTGVWPAYVEKYNHQAVPELAPRTWDLAELGR